MGFTSDLAKVTSAIADGVTSFQTARDERDQRELDALERDRLKQESNDLVLKQSATQFLGTLSKAATLAGTSAYKPFLEQSVPTLKKARLQAPEEFAQFYSALPPDVAKRVASIIGQLSFDNFADFALQIGRTNGRIDAVLNVVSQFGRKQAEERDTATQVRREREARIGQLQRSNRGRGVTTQEGFKDLKQGVKGAIFVLHERGYIDDLDNLTPENIALARRVDAVAKNREREEPLAQFQTSERELQLDAIKVMEDRGLLGAATRNQGAVGQGARVDTGTPGTVGQVSPEQKRVIIQQVDSEDTERIKNGQPPRTPQQKLARLQELIKETQGN